MFCRIWWDVIFDHWVCPKFSKRSNWKVVQAIELNCWSISGRSGLSTKIKRVNVHCCIVICLHIPVAVTFADARVTSSTAEFRSFLRSMCTDALEANTKYFSSSFFMDDTGRQRISEVEWNLALSFPVLENAVYHFPCDSLQTHRSGLMLTSSDRPLDFGARRSRSWEAVF